MKWLHMAATALVGIGAIVIGFGWFVSFFIFVEIGQYLDCLRQFPNGIGSRGCYDIGPPIICSDSIPPTYAIVLGMIVPLASGIAMTLFGLKKSKMRTLA